MDLVDIVAGLSLQFKLVPLLSRDSVSSSTSSPLYSSTLSSSLISRRYTLSLCNHNNIHVNFDTRIDKHEGILCAFQMTVILNPTCNIRICIKSHLQLQNFFHNFLQQFSIKVAIFQITEKIDTVLDTISNTTCM